MDLSLANQYITSWTPKSVPTSTSLSSIDPTALPALLRTISQVAQSAATETNSISLYFLSKKYRGAAASLTIVAGEKYIATATRATDLPEVTAAMFNATLNLKSLEWSSNLYAMNLNVPANALFTALFGIALITQIVLSFKLKAKYFGFCMSSATLLEFIGYLARTLAAQDTTNQSKYLCQIICLTIAPAFVMAGIYYLLALHIVVHGRRFSVLEPVWFSYIFIFCDTTSLFVQGIGGAYAAIMLKQFRPTAVGTHVMVGGIAFQVLSMTFFLYLNCDFIKRNYFGEDSDTPFSFSVLFRLLFNTHTGREIKESMDYRYNSKYKHIRSKRLFQYFPLVMLLSLVFVYVRCIYRVVELSEGWRGYLITHEAFVLSLDAAMIFLACALFIPFHPGLVFGNDESLSLKAILHERDLDHEDCESNKMKAVSRKRHTKKNKRSSRGSDTEYEEYTQTHYEVSSDNPFLDSAVEYPPMAFNPYTKETMHVKSMSQSSYEGSNTSTLNESDEDSFYFHTASR
ncbi:putative transporter or flippase transmembrane protein [Scheffersomyces stipitis CBS 6054]|uniref:Sphingoid long-chain base transporter RSB1 n=1 Tax=Scheffersomyces stipitis (strain ATCC 58785 / CBS 6054 / NBRC 10063 / NRRL Y-11545) TaxID=322104 RepID=A3GFL4_PICST|nr:putative transporter or flippase transmembrane protein [Scheffersomyces stipitis CBS 6054]EAZ63773.2 putative transporter or flippase transmembrane protein [Scheffersomyces stipitis CBS 6054]